MKWFRWHTSSTRDIVASVREVAREHGQCIVTANLHLIRLHHPNESLPQDQMIGTYTEHCDAVDLIDDVLHAMTEGNRQMREGA